LVPQRRHFRVALAKSADLIIEGMRAAKTAGAVVSFDLNFREKLWRAWGGEDHATAVFRRIEQYVDVLVGVANIAETVQAFPRIKMVAATLREVHSANRHSWSAAAWINGQNFTTPTLELDIYDRVGGGDGFAAGFFYGLLAGESAENALRLGWAHGALLTTFPGDTTMAKLADVRALAQGGSAKIQR
jgi:2-dehydro-3-deoxygluconokinase